ncbi:MULTISPECIES: anti-sigma factor [Methylotenera]|uniref:anti-sigma factor n=1 Tax=Methylotenera TaxID=359407 RepID=UPI00035E61E8|nr:MULTISPECIES: anti-sigma factor [Methylotenera]
MRYDNDKLADMLSVEYILGTLKGAARTRFEQLLKQRADWAQSFAWWESHIHLLADTVPAVNPPKRVWKTIETRLFAHRAAQSNSWWKSFAFISTALAASLATILVLQSPKPADEITPEAIALLSSEKAQHGWLLSETKNAANEVEMKAISLASLETKPDNAFELWLLPADKSKPISLGLLPQQGVANMKIPAQLVPLMAPGSLAVSLEPVGGSPTGQPTGAVLYQGKLAKT